VYKPLGEKERERDKGEQKKSNDCNNVDRAGSLSPYCVRVHIRYTDNKKSSQLASTITPPSPSSLLYIMLDQPARKKGSAIAKIPATIDRLLQQVHFYITMKG
jgi:hypothetical protein